MTLFAFLQAHIAALEVHNQEKIAAVSKLNQEAAREASEALAEANEKLAYESAEHDKAIQELADEMEVRIKVRSVTLKVVAIMQDSNCRFKHPGQREG